MLQTKLIRLARWFQPFSFHGTLARLRSSPFWQRLTSPSGCTHKMILSQIPTAHLGTSGSPIIMEERGSELAELCLEVVIAPSIASVWLQNALLHSKMQLFQKQGAWQDCSECAEMSFITARPQVWSEPAPAPVLSWHCLDGQQESHQHLCNIVSSFN